MFTSIGVFFYMMTISLSGFVLAAGCIAGSYWIFFLNYFKIKAKMKKVRLKEADKNFYKT